MGESLSKPFYPLVVVHSCLSDANFNDLVKYSTSAKYDRHPYTPHLNNCNYVSDSIIEWMFDFIPKTYSVDIIAHKGHSLQKFSVGESMGAHQDFADSYDDPKDFAPTMSLVYYVNDDFGGGEICFSTNRSNDPGSDQPIKIKPVANSCVVFDARLWHWVLPVTHSERYSYAIFLKTV